MRIKSAIILLIISLGLLSAAAVTGFRTVSLFFKNNLVALPKAEGNKSVSVKLAEEVNENAMLTYTSVYQKSVKALQINKTVSVIATNYTYPYVMGTPLQALFFYTRGAGRQRKSRGA